MAASIPPKSRAARPRLPLSEKRRIVELTQRGDAPVRTIAREHGISRNTLRRWLELYGAGKVAARPAPRDRGGAAGATFLPVAIASAGRARRTTAIPQAHTLGGDVVQLTFSSGDTLRIETVVLDAALICALVAELRQRT